MERERFSSRLGFLLISAGCAIGLGNVWRFPYITGIHGGAAFILIYLFFLITLGLPIMVMELAIGRGSQKSIALALDILEPPGTKWHLHKYGAMSGNYLLMMFYTTIGGWMLYYFLQMLTGRLSDLSPNETLAAFQSMLSNPLLMSGNMSLVVILCFGICALGLQKGVEKITKAMMLILLALMLLLALRSVLLPNSNDGLRFYLYPDFSKLTIPAVSAAMGQAFFTLSLGIGSMTIFGSYIDKSRSLLGEALYVTGLDTGVALLAGLIIFPACFAFGIKPDSGPSLLFITLPSVFSAMPGGRFWGSLFFLFLFFAAASTIVAVFENIISFAMDLFGFTRKKAVLYNLVAILLLSLPCIFGFNIWKNFKPLGQDSGVLELLDFFVSNNLLPIGSIIFLLFCSTRYGWGYSNFLKETNKGLGIRFPKWAQFYVSFILPAVVIFLFIQGYLPYIRGLFIPK